MDIIGWQENVDVSETGQPDPIHFRARLTSLNYVDLASIVLLYTNSNNASYGLLTQGICGRPDPSVERCMT